MGRLGRFPRGGEPHGDLVRRRALWGLAALGAYLAVAIFSPGSPSRPLFDVSGPPPAYRWANPPSPYAAGNVKPEGTTHDLILGSSGSDAASIATGDGQAAIVLKEGSFAPLQGEKAVVIKIDPLDPVTIAPPPGGLRYDGNAYRILAAYKKSGVEAKLMQPATAVLSFPIVATHLFRRDANVWTDLKANPVSVSLQIFATTTQLGTFVAVGPPLADNPPKKGKFPAALVISLGAAGAAVFAGLIGRTRARRKRSVVTKSSKKTTKN
jgi:hypothetical protein